MLETAVSRPLATEPVKAKTRKRSRMRDSSAVRGYALLLLFIAVGWLLRDLQLYSPAEGVGYWMGIIGGSLMLTLLLYPLRKRIKFLHKLGPTKYWFQMHMVLGLIGPLLILYHCNFQLGSFNSQVALYCMVLVAGSGIIGTALGPCSPGSAYVLLHHYMGEVDGVIGAWGFARGVGYQDTTYFDEGAAKSAGYRNLPAPPSYMGTPIFIPGKSNDTFSGPKQSGPGLNHGLKNVLDGGTETEYFEDICAGDTLRRRW